MYYTTEYVNLQCLDHPAETKHQIIRLVCNITQSSLKKFVTVRQYEVNMQVNLDTLHLSKKSKN